MTEPTIVDFFLDQKPSVELHDTMSGEKNLYPECYAATTNDRVLIYSYRDGIHPQRPRASMPIQNLVVTHYGDHPAVRSVPDTPKPPEQPKPPQIGVRKTPGPVAAPEYYNLNEDPNADSGDFSIPKMMPTRPEKHRVPLTNGQPVKVMPLEPTEEELSKEIPLSEQTLTKNRIAEQIQEMEARSFNRLPDSPPGSGSDQNGGESPSAWQAAKQIVFSKDSDDSGEPQSESESEWQPRGKQARIGGHRKVNRVRRAATSLLAPVFLGFALLGRSYDMG